MKRGAIVLTAIGVLTMMAPMAGGAKRQATSAPTSALRSGGVEEAFRPLRLGEVSPDGWLRAQVERDLVSGFQGHLDSLLQDLSKHFFLRPEYNDFVTRAQNKDSRLDAQGLAIPAGEISWFNGELIGDWQDSLIRAAFLVGDRQTREKVDGYVAAMLKSQDPDGYIGIYPKGFRFYFSRTDAELWTQRCALLGLLAYYEFTGNKSVLVAVEKAVKSTVHQYGPGRSYFDNPGQTNSGVAHGLMFLDVLEWLYRLTGDDEYRRAALSLYDDYNASRRVKNQDAQLAKLLDPKIPLNGHGPDVMGYLRVPMMCYYYTGREDYRRAWENMVVKIERHLGVGGSPLSGHREEIKESGQTPDMPYEYCSTFYLLHSLTWAMQKTGQARFGDMIERTLFNAAQGARFPNGKALTFYSADERLWVRQKPPEGQGNLRFLYTAASYPSCCHNSGARTYPYAISSMWMRSPGSRVEPEGLVAMLYGPSRVATEIGGTQVEIVERTTYPFSYDMEFVISTARPHRFPLRFRLPAWSGEPVLDAAGAVITRDPRGFLVAIKNWKTGDRVKLSLRPVIRGQKALNGTTALTYGPLVFSLPVPEVAQVIQRFPEAEAMGLQGFYGYQYDPADLVSAKRPLALPTGLPEFGFRVVREGAADSAYPWEQVPLKLQGELAGAEGRREPVVLLPLGATLLRRTCFPVEP